MTKQIRVNFDPDQGLLPDETKSSSELMLPYHRYGLTPFTYNGKSTDDPHELQLIRKLHIKNHLK